MAPDSWFENLPQNCPPSAAENPSNRLFYRLVRGFPPSAEDFESNRALFPTRVFRIDECIVRSLSVFESESECLKIKKLPLHKDQTMVGIRLPEISGVVMLTSRNTHYSWWRRRGFDPISACVLVSQ
jgi:hypothetical protein